MSKRVQVKVRKRNHMWEVSISDKGSSWLRRAKADAVELGVKQCRIVARAGGKAELTIYNRDGRIGKGNGARRTYPRSSDPRRRKG